MLFHIVCLVFVLRPMVYQTILTCSVRCAFSKVQSNKLCKCRFVSKIIVFCIDHSLVHRQQHWTIQRKSLHMNKFAVKSSYMLVIFHYIIPTTVLHTTPFCTSLKIIVHSLNIPLKRYKILAVSPSISTVLLQF